jgi:hypothetical protein
MFATPSQTSRLVMRHGFTNGVTARTPQPLSDEQIRRVAPSVFAENPWQGMTNKYLFIPTAEIVGEMRKEGFEVVQAMQGNVRIEGKGEFTKHLLRFALPQADEVVGSRPELVLINSHDGTSSYQLMLGFIRYICTNRLLIADNVTHLRFRHSRSLAAEILEGTGTLVREVPRVSEQVQRLAGIQLNEGEQQAFASAAHTLRWGGAHAPVQAADLLQRRRREGDEGADLYTTLNVVQENIIMGGLAGKTATNKRTHTRAVAGVQANVHLNMALSTLAQELARHKAN